ncbi:MAG: radical SAM protein [Pseudomonadota bacterium]
MFYSCEWIEYRLVLDHFELKFCCKAHSGDKGFVPICLFEGGDLPVDTIKEARKKLRKLNNTEGADSPCKGCPFLVNRDWEKLEDTVLFNQVEISNFTICNLKCNYCYTVVHPEWNLKKYAYELKPVFQSMIDNNLLQEKSTIDWAGGEPTILKDFGELSATLQAKGHIQKIFTNAVVFSKEIEQGLLNRTISIVTSVDSGTPETFKLVKGKDCFDAVCRNIQRYAATGGSISLKYIVKKDNSATKDIDGFINLCKRCNVKSIGITPDINELALKIVTDQSLYAAAMLANKAAKQGITCDLQYDYFGPEYSEKITRALSLKANIIRRAKNVARAGLRMADSIKATARKTAEPDLSLITGWWIFAAQPGTGISLEIQGDRIYLTWQVFDSKGSPVWYSCLAWKTDEKFFKGSLCIWNSLSLDNVDSGARSEQIGMLELKFRDENHVSLNWNTQGGWKEKKLERYMSRIVPRGKDPERLSGWWNDPEHKNTGFFIDVRGKKVFLSWCHYDDSGKPRWMVSGGDSSLFDPVSRTYSGKLQVWNGGQTLNGSYTSPEIAELDPITLHFLDNKAATIDWKDKRFNLRRHSF